MYIYMVVLPRQARVSIRDKHMRRKLRKERYYYCCCYCCCCRLTHAEDYWVETCEALGAEPASGLRCALEIRFRLVACVTVVPAGCWLLAAGCWPGLVRGRGRSRAGCWLLADDRLAACCLPPAVCRVLAVPTGCTVWCTYRMLLCSAGGCCSAGWSISVSSIAVRTRVQRGRRAAR